MHAARFLRLSILVSAVLALPALLRSQEKPYFVTYSTDLEEPGNLEIAYKGLSASPKTSGAFASSTLELEYGATAWWTTELYLQGQSTRNDSTIFTGYRLENRFRPLPRQYWVTPVIYVEYEAINGAEKSILEVVGNDGVADLEGKNADNRREVAHEIEGKLILSSNLGGWNISENIIAEKNLGNEPWEFGYAVGAARSLASSGSAHRCTFCRQNFDAGAELYGGLGTRAGFGLHDTSHYAGPVVDYRIPSGPTISFSPQFGLNDNCVGALWRFKVSYEVQQFRDYFRKKETQ